MVESRMFRKCTMPVIVLLIMFSIVFLILCWGDCDMILACYVVNNTRRGSVAIRSDSGAMYRRAPAKD